MSDGPTGFTPGFNQARAARHAGVAEALQQAFAPPGGFAAVDLQARAARPGPASFVSQENGPRHFSPADPSGNPTEGWDPFNASATASQPFTDPVAAAHAAGYAEGAAAALAELGEAGARDRALLESLAEALRSDGRLDRERMARQLRQTVLFLVTRLVGDVGIAPDLLTRRIESAADLLADAAESAMLRLHPADVALLEGTLPTTVFAVGDTSVARGSFVLESASTIVEDGPDLWLEQLAQAIERVAVPAT